jgi:hypothetical protein
MKQLTPLRSIIVNGRLLSASGRLAVGILRPDGTYWGEQAWGCVHCQRPLFRPGDVVKTVAHPTRDDVVLFVCEDCASAGDVAWDS